MIHLPKINVPTRSMNFIYSFMIYSRKLSVCEVIQKLMIHLPKINVPTRSMNFIYSFMIYSRKLSVCEAIQDLMIRRMLGEWRIRKQQKGSHSALTEMLIIAKRYRQKKPQNTPERIRHQTRKIQFPLPSQTDTIVWFLRKLTYEFLHFVHFCRQSLNEWKK